MMGVPLAWRLRTAVWTAVIPPLLSCVSFQWLARRLGRLQPTSPDSIGVSDLALAALVDRILRRLPGPWRHTCLRRSAVLYHLLRRAGRPVELWVGVRHDSAGALAAHAWLVRDGKPYLERQPYPAAQHTVIARFPEL
jgi:hypothetical protein